MRVRATLLRRVRDMVVIRVLVMPTTTTTIMAVVVVIVAVAVVVVVVVLSMRMTHVIELARCFCLVLSMSGCIGRKLGELEWWWKGVTRLM